MEQARIEWTPLIDHGGKETGIIGYVDHFLLEQETDELYNRLSETIIWKQQRRKVSFSTRTGRNYQFHKVDPQPWTSDLEEVTVRVESLWQKEMGKTICLDTVFLNHYANGSQEITLRTLANTGNADIIDRSNRNDTTNKLDSIYWL